MYHNACGLPHEPLQAPRHFGPSVTSATFDSQMKDSIWNYNPEKFVKECKRLRALCQRIIAGEESLIEGSRKMLQYRFWMKEEANDTWTIFQLLDSESDHLPVGPVRSHWNPEVLKEKDKEINQIEAFYKDAIQKAASRIFDQYEEYVEQGHGANAQTRVAHDRR